MSIIEYIILSFALGFEVLITMRGCACHTPVRLTKGLLESLLVAVVGALLLFGGMGIGDLMRFSPANPDVNATTTNALLSQTDELVYLGLLLLVAFRLFFRSFKKNRAELSFDISKLSTVLMLSVVLGINVLIVGLALGFHVDYDSNVWRASIPLLIVFFLLSMVGVMFGRRQLNIHARRWTLVAALFILIFAIKDFIWN